MNTNIFSPTTAKQKEVYEYTLEFKRMHFQKYEPFIIFTSAEQLNIFFPHENIRIVRDDVSVPKACND